MKFVILGSGTGSNAEAILKAWKAGDLGRAEPVHMISDRADARILTLGEQYGIASSYVYPGKFKTKLTEETERAYVDAIRETGADLIVLAGFMRVLHKTFLEAFEGKIINLHPSILPSFKGLHAIEKAYVYGVKYTGCSVHYVDNTIDGGKIIDQAVVRIEEEDTLDSLESKVHAAEHVLLPSVIRRISEE